MWLCSVQHVTDQCLLINKLVSILDTYYYIFEVISIDLKVIVKTIKSHVCQVTHNALILTHCPPRIRATLLAHACKADYMGQWKNG